jgi:DNA-binding winged helix-turn-helix (wHTH) protein/tetratricopeptide (TPR) repeat protein
VSAHPSEHERPATALTLRFGDCELDFARRELRRAGAVAPLQPTPLRLLLYLAEHRDRTVPKQELLDAIWPDAAVGDASLAKALANVREAVGDHGDEQRVIRTQRGAGVRFVAEVAKELASAAPVITGAATRSREARAAGVALAVVVLAVAAFSGWRERARRPALPPHLLAVIPFRNLGGDSALDALAAGLTAGIADALLPPAHLLPSASARAHQGVAIDLREPQRAHGATHVLQGTVQGAKGRVRVVVQLHETAGNRLIWSERFEEPLADPLAAQAAISSRVAATVPLLLPFSAAASPELESIEKALDFAMGRWATGENEAALAALNGVLARAPQNARAHALVTHVWLALVTWEKRSLDEARAKIASHAHEAQRLAPGSADAHAAAAVAHALEFAWTDAERDARAGCEQSARASVACGQLRQILLATGRAQEAVEISRSALEAFPNAAFNHFDLANALTVQRRFDDAIRAYRRAAELDPFYLGSAGLVDLTTGRGDEYVAEMRTTLVQRGDSAGAAEIERLSLDGGPRAVARWAAEHPARFDPLAPTWMHALTSALHFALIGEEVRALDALDAAAWSPGLPQFSSLPGFDAIRDHPRFLALIEQMKLTPHHDALRARLRAAR